jgi:hypothetical protein
MDIKLILSLATLVGFFVLCVFAAIKLYLFLRNPNKTFSNSHFVKKFLGSQLFPKAKQSIIAVSYIVAYEILFVVIILFCDALYQILSGHYSWFSFLFLLTPLILIEATKEIRAANHSFREFSDKIFDPFKPFFLSIKTYLKLAGKVLLFTIKWSAIAFFVYLVLSAIEKNPILLVVAMLGVIIYQLDKINRKKPPRD